jgi:IS5 family transposase
VSRKKRKRVEEIFGWMKTVAWLRKARYKGVEKIDRLFTLSAAAYNLVRMRNLGVAASG